MTNIKRKAILRLYTFCSALIVLSLIGCGPSAEEKANMEKKRIQERREVQLSKTSGPDIPIVVRDNKEGDFILTASHERAVIFQYEQHQYIKFDDDKWAWGGHYPECDNPICRAIRNIKLDSVYTATATSSNLSPRENWIIDSMKAVQNNFYIAK